MGHQIGIDPLDLEAMVQKAVDATREVFDKLPLEAQQQYRKYLAIQAEQVVQLMEEEQRKTLNYVLQMMDVLERVEKSPMLRAAIIKFRDEV